MLTALRGKQYTMIVQNGRNPGVDGLRRLHAGAFADPLPHDFAGGTADDQQIARTQHCGGQQFGSGCFRLFFYFFEHFDLTLFLYFFFTSGSSRCYP
jgi:hypothetical protein